MTNILALLAFFFFSIFMAIARGFVVTKLWGWFLVPLGIPAVHVAAAVGICLLITFVVDHTDYVKQAQQPKLTHDQNLEVWGRAVATPWVALLLGYVVHCFI